MMTTPQIEEFVFSHADFPREFDIQLWAFVRLVWGENLSGEDRFRTRSWDDPSPTHFVRAAGDCWLAMCSSFHFQSRAIAGR